MSGGVERKGNLDYLSWAYAWNALCEEHPDANFYFADPTTYPDGSVMVKAVVTVGEKTHEMTLPVMDHRNKAIQNPNARDISDAQMRCRSALRSLDWESGYTLGDLKHVVQHTDFEKAQQFIDAGDYMALHQFVKGLSEKDQVELFNNAPMGEKTNFKNAHRATMKQAEEFLDSESAEAIGDAVTQSDAVLLAETVDELSTYERTAVWARLNGEQQEAVKQLRTEAGVDRMTEESMLAQGFYPSPSTRTRRTL